MVALLTVRPNLVDGTRKSNQMCGLKVDFAHKIGCHGYGHSSTISANWVKIGQVDVQNKALTEALKRERFISPPSVALRSAGWANKSKTDAHNDLNTVAD